MKGSLLILLVVINASIILSSKVEFTSKQSKKSVQKIIVTNTKTINFNLSSKSSLFYIVYHVRPTIKKHVAEQIVNSIVKFNHGTGLTNLELLALCTNESTLYKYAKSSTDDHGLCQINANTYKLYNGSTELKFVYNIANNIELATKILRDNIPCLLKYNVVNKELKKYTIMAYNMGPYNATKLRKIDKAKYLSDFSKKVAEFKFKLKPSLENNL